jgi:hypothetical protein
MVGDRAEVGREGGVRHAATPRARWDKVMCPYISSEVVPANAGNHTPCPIDSSAAYGSRLKAGTTAGSSETPSKRPP